MTASSATVTYAGRLVSLQPAELGKMFESACTVTVMEQVPPTAENGWKRSRKADDKRLYWYDKDPQTGELAFVTLAGYGQRIEADLSTLGLPVTMVDRRPSGLQDPNLGALKGISWRIKQPEVISKILAFRGGTIVCPTAFGKTFIIKQLARIYPEAKIVITVTARDVALGMYNDLRYSLSNVGFCGDGQHHPDRVTVAISKSLKYCDTDANLLLADEAHTLLTEAYMKDLNRFRRAKFFAFTATPTGRSDGADGYMEAIFGPEIISVSYQEAVTAGNVVQLEVRMVRCDDGPNVAGIDRKDIVDGRGIIRNDARNRLVVQAARDLEAELGEESQILIMVDKVEHAYLLGQMLPEYAIITGKVSPEREAELRGMGAMTDEQALCSYKDRDRQRIAFEKNELKLAIATRVWEKGVDFVDLAALVRADGLASPIAASQVPGRLSRLGKDGKKAGGILVDIYDQFSRNLRSRSNTRVRSYKDNGWPVRFTD